ncbi:MAG: choice-of-anchor tandem repeat NxxGxxAF-containing protein [Coleofasciculaceae cyanobacterium]
MFKSTDFNLSSKYTYQLQARCDSGALLRVRQSVVECTHTYNLPDNYSFGNISPAINNQGNVAFKVLGHRNQAIWYGNNYTGRLVYTAPKAAFLSKVSLNNQGCLVWEQLRSHTNGIWHYNAAQNISSLLTTSPIGSCGWAAATINDQGGVGFRAKFAEAYGLAVYHATDATTATLALMSNLDAASIYSFLFLPAFNNQGKIAAKVRLGEPGAIGNERPDQIRLFDFAGDSKLIVANCNYDPDLPYQSFDNSVSCNDNGQVAFIANLKSGQRGVFRFDGTVKAIALEGEQQLSRIERFPPKLNNHGLIIFRGFDKQGLRAIWAGDGTTLQKVVSEGDLLPTDLGILQLARPDQGAVFIGTPDLNDQAEIVFAASLSDPQNTRIGFGAGVFVARTLATESREFGN